MNISTDLIYDAKRKMLAKYPRFCSEIAVANIEYRDNLKYHTAATDGKNIYVDPKYFENLSESDRLFTIAHEIMHIKFMHMFRLKNKEGKKRDPELWNIATDAIINANLERDGFTIKDGYVNMPEALNYSAEEFYQKLLQEKEKQEQENGQNKQKSQGNQEQKNNDEQERDDNGQGNGQNNEQDKKEKQDETQKQDGEQENSEQNSGKSESQDEEQENTQGDDHSLWEEAFEEQQKKDLSQKQKGQKKDSKEPQQNQTQEEEQIPDKQVEESFDEKQEFEDNRREKREKFKSRSEKTKKDIREASEGTIKLENIGETKEAIDWKVLLRREVEKTETIWSQRRSIAENNYAYRLEENDIEDEAETEVMIDVSGSVNLELVKAFLRQLKPLLKQSKLKVGCFNEKFWGLVDIKNVRDIDNFTIPQGARGHSAWTEDWDLAVRSFTKKREINKIVFTDGYPCPGTMPKEDLKRENVIWLVYGNEDFNPCCGKVINITEKQLEQLNLKDKNNAFEDMSR